MPTRSAVFEAIFSEEITLPSEGDMFRPPQYKEVDGDDIAQLTADRSARGRESS